MSMVTVRIPTPLRSFTGGADEIRATGGTLGEALREVDKEHAGLLDRVVDPQGKPRRFVNIFVGEKNIRSLGGLDTPLDDGAVVTILPAVAGGAR